MIFAALVILLIDIIVDERAIHRRYGCTHAGYSEYELEALKIPSNIKTKCLHQLVDYTKCSKKSGVSRFIFNGYSLRNTALVRMRWLGSVAATKAGTSLCTQRQLPNSRQSDCLEEEQSIRIRRGEGESHLGKRHVPPYHLQLPSLTLIIHNNTDHPNITQLNAEQCMHPFIITDFQS